MSVLNNRKKLRGLKLKHILISYLCIGFLCFSLSGAEKPIVISDFEKNSGGWGLGLGKEFPGAQGMLAIDKTIFKEGNASLRLEGDFSKGGRFVEAAKWDLGEVPLKTLAFWLKTDGAKHFTIRLIDSTGQWHQRKNISLKPGTDWQKVILTTDDICGKEHWGGANDGKWSGLAKGISIMLEKNSLPESGKGSLWLDKIEANPTVGKVQQEITFDDFESDGNWKLDLGGEVPGANADMELDKNVYKEGKSSGRLNANFSKGGLYIKIQKTFSSQLEDISEIAFWMKSSGIKGLNIQIIDKTGQVHQKKGIPLKETDDWQKVVLPISAIVGGEHWGGANDGKWHQPGGSLVILADKRNLKDNTEEGILWIDEIRVKASILEIKSEK